METNNLIKSENRIEFSEQQVALIKSLIAKDCSNDELQLFLYQCKRTGLDPLTRQIYCIKRAGRMTIQTSIDGFRVIAERSGTYAGQDEPTWEDDEKGNPVKCTVRVYRFSDKTGERYLAGVGTAYFKEYYPSPMNLQKSMPHMMIAKVAEALALRKAYPQDLSGLYTGDEMEQSDKPHSAPQAPIDEESSKETSQDIVLAGKIKLVGEATNKKDLIEWAAKLPAFVGKHEKFREAVKKKLAELEPQTT